MKKTAIPIVVFTVISNVIVLYSIVFSGIGTFFLFWRESSLKYTIGIIIIAFIWYLMWIKHIKDKKVFAKLSTFDHNDSLSVNADEDPMSLMCPECEKDCYYFSKVPDESRILICWNCQHTFSFVWCEKCGMGGDFIGNIPENPQDWECPDCHNTYSISSNIFVNSTNTTSDKNLPINVHLSRLARQMKSEKEQAITSVWFLSSILISFTLVLPMVNSLNKTFINQGLMGLNGSASHLLYSCGSSLVYIMVFVSTWYGLILYPLALIRKFRQSQN